MKNWLPFMLFIVLMSGCSNSIHGNSMIDWADFVKLNGNSYTGLTGRVIKDQNDITGKVVGVVKFKVADVVKNPKYRTKEGDAAFLEIGTNLYEVKGFQPNELIAAWDETVIGGYRLYAEDEFAKTMIHNYNDVPKDKVNHISLYSDNEVKPYKTLYNQDKEKFIQLLETGIDSHDYKQPYREGFPIYYTMVFYTDEPIANAFFIADDGKVIYFQHWRTKIVHENIRKLLE